MIIKEMNIISNEQPLTRRLIKQQPRQRITIIEDKHQRHGQFGRGNQALTVVLQ